MISELRPQIIPSISISEIEARRLSVYREIFAARICRHPSQLDSLARASICEGADAVRRQRWKISWSWCEFPVCKTPLGIFDPDAESQMRKVRLRRRWRQQLAPSSIKTSQIDAVVKREEESCRHLRDSMPLHSRFPHSLFRARNPRPLSRPLSHRTLFRESFPYNHLASDPSSSLARTSACITQSNLRGVAFYNHVNLS